MWTHLSILSFLCLLQLGSSFLQEENNTQIALADKSCKTQIDSLTKKLIYTTTDVLATNEGGRAALMKKLERGVNTEVVVATVVPESYNPNIIVAFIVDIDGSIKGEGIIKDETNKVGQQLLAIVKTLKWTSAKCGSKNVATLYMLPIIIDISEQ